MAQSLGNLRKMDASCKSPVEYGLRLDDDVLPLQPHKQPFISFRYLGDIFCIQCGRKTRKSFQQGLCYPCMQRINECGNCIIHPERCLVEQGNCPKDDWAHAHCHADQIVYLSNTSTLKVGVTRASQVPTRWIDQGAMQALPMFSASNRYQAGLLEVAFKPFVKDKTNWRVMLKQDSVLMDMCAERDRLLHEAAAALEPILSRYPDQISLLSEEVVHIQFPVKDYPEKVTSLSLDKTPEVSGRLLGIKGQYLLLDTGVLNVRKFSGYRVEVSQED